MSLAKVDTQSYKTVKYAVEVFCLKIGLMNDFEKKRNKNTELGHIQNEIGGDMKAPNNKDKEL